MSRSDLRLDTTQHRACPALPGPLWSHLVLPLWYSLYGLEPGAPQHHKLREITCSRTGGGGTCFVYVGAVHAPQRPGSVLEHRESSLVTTLRLRAGASSASTATHHVLVLGHVHVPISCQETYGPAHQPAPTAVPRFSLLRGPCARYPSGVSSGSAT
eukprot:13721787-Heterocapsa_arctica.AAC.1